MTILLGLMVALLLVVVHEVGHHIVGRLAGLPAHSARIVVSRFPPRVELAQGERWLAPDDPGYVEAFRRRCDGRAAAWWFVAGGFVVETTALLAVAGIAAGLGEPSVVRFVALISLQILAVYLIADLATLRSGSRGDASSMWLIARDPTLLLIAALIALRVGLIAATWG